MTTAAGVLEGRPRTHYPAASAALRGAPSILTIGPDGAPGEMGTRLECDAPGTHIVALATADRMTDRPVAARVRAYFQP